MGSGTEIKQKLDELMLQSNQAGSLDNYDEITLSEEEVTEALRKGREQKYLFLKRTEYNEKLNRPLDYLKYSHTQILDYYKSKYTIDDANKSVVENMCMYFTEEKGKYDLNKGLMLIGGVGIGKTTLMEFFRRNQKASYRLMSCREIESDFSSEGEKSVAYCSYNVQIATNSNPFGHQEIGFCFDDLGTEANGKHFGKEKNVIAEIILNRYDNRLPYHYTHLTTNLTAEEIRSQYGTRVTDRMREMFNIITFDKNAKSRR